MSVALKLTGHHKDLGGGQQAADLEASTQILVVRLEEQCFCHRGFSVDSPGILRGLCRRAAP